MLPHPFLSKSLRRRSATLASATYHVSGRPTCLEGVCLLREEAAPAPRCLLGWGLVLRPGVGEEGRSGRAGPGAAEQRPARGARGAPSQQQQRQHGQQERAVAVPGDRACAGEKGAVLLLHEGRLSRSPPPRRGVGRRKARSGGDVHAGWRVPWQVAWGVCQGCTGGTSCAPLAELQVLDSTGGGPDAPGGRCGPRYPFKFRRLNLERAGSRFSSRAAGRRWGAFRIT
jgi:hypothetical protein